MLLIILKAYIKNLNNQISEMQFAQGNNNRSDGCNRHGAD